MGKFGETKGGVGKSGVLASIKATRLIAHCRKIKETLVCSPDSCSGFAM